MRFSIIAQFIGADGSCGFRHGRAYELESSIIGKYIWLASSDGKRCPYASLEKILENWKIIS